MNSAQRSTRHTLVLATLGAILLLGLTTCDKLPYSFTASRYPLVANGVMKDIAQRMEAKGSLAAGIAVIEDGNIIWTGNFGWRDKKYCRPVTDTTLFNYGSCAKVITATAMMKLVDQGLVDLDEPVVTYLPEFQMADPRYTDITVRMLLNHSSGIPGTSLRGANTIEPAHDEHMAVVLDNLAQNGLKADPGAFSVYCNDGFSVAEMVVARVSGKRFSQFVKDEIFTPLGMNHSQTADDPYKPGSRVANRKELTPSPYEIMNVYGSGGFSLSASDWCRLLDALGRGGISANGVRVLSEASAAAMVEDQTLSHLWLSNGAGFGLGWDTVRQGVFDEAGIVALAKSGGTTYYTSQVIVLPELNLGVAISCAGNDLGVADVAVLALEAVLKRKGIITGLADAPAAAAEAALPAGQRDYAGYYARGVLPLSVEFADDDSLSVYGRSNGEWVTIASGLTWRENGRYAAEGSTEEYYFEDVPGHGAYLMHAMPEITGKAPIATTPFAQSVAPFAAPADAIEAWKARAGTWVIANTAPNSGTLGSPSNVVETFDDLPGIVTVAGCPLHIQSATDATMFLQIPYSPGRDMNNAHVLDDNNWIRFGALIYQPANAIPALAIAPVTIGAEGFSEWRQSATAQTLTITGEGENARWATYDASFNETADSLCEGTTQAAIPAGGYIQFLGAPSTTFTLTN